MISELVYCNEAEARTAFSEEHIAILPVGAVEVHGDHLPCSTDILLCTNFIKKLAEHINTNVILMPPVNYGQVWSLQDFPGSINIQMPVLTQFISDIGRSLFRHGTRVLVIAQGHLGNAPAVKDASRILYKELGMKVFTFSYNGMEKAYNILETPRAHHHYMHACEIETSLLMYLSPENVDLTKAVVNYPKFPAEFDFTPSPWSSVTKTAVLGDPTKASAEKGKALVEASIEYISSILNEYIVKNGVK